MKILITGGSGDLGSELVKRFARYYHVVAPHHDVMDVTDHDQVLSVMKFVKPDLVIHAAAITDARTCETDWKEARAVNVNGTYNVAMAALKVKAKMIHVSTACVFDGTSAPFNENTKPSPKNWYSMTKVAAESIVLAASPNFLVIRTNFVARKPWKYQAAFIDRYGTYLFADDVAYGIDKVLEMTGVVHVCGDQKLSMYELARMVSPKVKMMTLADYQGPPLTVDMSLESIRVDPFKLGCAMHEMLNM